MKQTRIAQLTLYGIVIGAVVLLTAAFARYPGVAQAGGIVRASARPANVTGQTAPTGICNRSWWDLSPIVTPTSSFPTLYGVAATSYNNAWAVGYNNPNGGAAQLLIEHFNGQTWSVSPVTIAGSTLYGVTALAANNAWAVGTDFNGTLVEHWDGSAWTVITSPNEAGTTADQLKSVAAVAANDIWAVGFAYPVNGGNAQLIEHWDGTSWSIVTGPDTGLTQVTLTSVAASSATDVWMVGNGYTSASVYNSFVEHWNGSARTVTDFAPDPTTAETLPLKRREVLIGSPSVAFAFGINASQFEEARLLRAVSGDPSTGRALRSGGTRTVTMRASPAAEKPCVCVEMIISDELYFSSAT